MMIEGAKDVAKNVVDGLSQSPIALTLIAFNAIVFAFLFWSLHEMGDRNDRRWNALMTACLSDKKSGD